MKKREIPRICTVDEFAKSKQLDADTLLYLTPEEFGNAMAGIKPSNLPPVGVGFDIVSLPGGGFVGFPRCGLGQVPLIRNGVMRCVPHEGSIGEQCGLRLIPGGEMRCEGSCDDEKARCVRLLTLSEGSFSIRCGCVPLIESLFAGALRGRSGPTPGGEGSVLES